MATFIGTDANNNVTYQVEPDAKKTMLPNTGVAKFQDEITQLKSDFDAIEYDISAKANAIFDTASGAIVTVTDGADDIPMKSLVCKIDPVQAGTGDPSPENIRPITGHTGVEVEKTGCNQWDEVTESGALNTTSGAKIQNDNLIRTANYIPVIGGATYAMATKSGSGNGVWMMFYDSTKSLITSDLPNVDTSSNARRMDNGQVFTVPSNCAYVRFYFQSGYGTTYNHDTSLNLPSSITAYNPYKANQTIPITFPYEAGTVYGGYVDVVKGKLVVNKKMVNASSFTSFDGIRTLTDGSGKCVYKLNAFPSGWGGANVISDVYKRASVSQWESLKYGEFTNTTTLIITIPNSITTVAEAVAYFNEHDATFVYTGVSNLTEYDIDPVTVKTLLGINNVWNSTGDTAIDYPCDTKLYIERLTQPTEGDMVANSNIVSGKYFMVGNDLYLSTTTIPAGDTINPGTNCTRVSIADALNAINS